MLPPHLHHILSGIQHDRRGQTEPELSNRQSAMNPLSSAALAALIVLCGNLVLRWMRFTLFTGTDMTDVRWEQASLWQTIYLTFSSCLQVLLWVLLAYCALQLLRRRYQFIVMAVLVVTVLIVGELDMAWYRMAHRHATLNDSLAFITEFASWRDQYGISTASALQTMVRIGTNCMAFFAIYYIIRRVQVKFCSHSTFRFQPTIILPFFIILALADSGFMGYGISERRDQWVEVARQNPLRFRSIDYIFHDWFSDSTDLAGLQLEFDENQMQIARPIQKSPAVAAAPVKPDILILAVEGFSSNLVDADTTPNFNNFTKRAIVARNHYSSGNVTEYGVLGLLYGEPLGFYRGTDTLPWRTTKMRQDPLAHSRYLQQLSTHGYKTQAIAPGVINWAGVSNYLSDFTELALLPQTTDGVAKAIVEQVRKPGPDLVFAYYGATHFPYHHSKHFAKFQPETPDGFDFLGGDLHAHEDDIRNRYRNCLLEFDTWFAQLLDKLDLRKTIVIVTGDHGEEFFERGRLSHASSLDKPQISTPLAIFIPGQAPGVITKVTSHLDVMETLFDVLGFPSEPSAYGRSFFLDDHLAHAAVAMRNRPKPPDTFAIVTNTRKVIIDIATKRVILETYPDDTELPPGRRPDTVSIEAVRYFLQNR